MARPTVKVTGQQGQWWVNAGPLGRLPTAHIHYLKREWYEYRHRADGADKLLGPGWSRKYDELLALLRERMMVVVTRDDVIPNGTAIPDFKRKPGYEGYVAVFPIDSLSEVDGVLRYRVVFAERVDVKK